MSETLEILQRKVGTARELKSVVRTMKAIALSSIVQYEQAVRSLAGYYRAVELSLTACFRGAAQPATRSEKPSNRSVLAIVFGSDQGLVGQFNEHAVSLAAGELARSQGRKVVWAVGERCHETLQELGNPASRLYAVPNSVQAITPLVSQILVDTEALHDRSEKIYLFYNQPKSRVAYEPVKERLIPLDDQWRRDLSRIQWPTKMLPQVVGPPELTITALIHEYLFVSLFRACAESLASENASRLAAMQRAQRSIEDLLERLQTAFHQKRQAAIDEELFEVVSGFEALANPAS